VKYPKILLSSACLFAVTSLALAQPSGSRGGPNQGQRPPPPPGSQNDNNQGCIPVPNARFALRITRSEPPLNRMSHLQHAHHAVGEANFCILAEKIAFFYTKNAHKNFTASKKCAALHALAKQIRLH